MLVTPHTSRLCLALVPALALACLLPSCETVSCDRDPPLSWSNYGEAFMLTYCDGCHSSLHGESARFGAPIGVDFNTYGDVMLWVDRIDARSTGESPGMPPSGGPSPAEIERLEEWLQCSVYPDAERLEEEGS